MRVLVCGGREFHQRAVLRKALSALEGVSVIISGGAPGADRMAEEWARHQGIPTIRMDANWTRYGRKAGPMRNQWMIDLASPDLVVAFPGGHGTDDMVRRARVAGIEVREIS